MKRHELIAYLRSQGCELLREGGGIRGGRIEPSTSGPAEVKKGLATYFTFYNEKRWHQNFDRKTPAMVYFNTLPQRQAAV